MLVQSFKQVLGEGHTKARQKNVAYLKNSSMD